MSRLRELVVQIRDGLENIRKNDATQYEHHQPRRFDGKTPREAGHDATRWLEPREIAVALTRRIDAVLAEIDAEDTGEQLAPNGNPIDGYPRQQA